MNPYRVLRWGDALRRMDRQIYIAYHRYMLPSPYRHARPIVLAHIFMEIANGEGFGPPPF